jgi:hypothetical protein
MSADARSWSADFPHTESTWPRLRRTIEHDFADVSVADLIEMASGNAAKLYGFRVNGG